MKGVWVLESLAGGELSVNHEHLFRLNLDCVKLMRFGDFMYYKARVILNNISIFSFQ